LRWRPGQDDRHHDTYDFSLSIHNFLRAPDARKHQETVIT
jgi:hypothetical protein